MERNFFSEGFEGFLREKADQYKLYPSDRVWKNIDRELRPRRKWPYLAAVLLLLGLGIGARQYLGEQETPIARTSLSAKVNENKVKVASLNPSAPTEKAFQGSKAGSVSRSTSTPAARRLHGLHEVSLTSESLSPRTVANTKAGNTPDDLMERHSSIPPSSEPGYASDIVTHEPAVMETGHALPDLRPHAPLIDILPKTSPEAPKAEQTLTPEQYSVNPVVPPNVFAPPVKKWNFEMYVTPSVSYRRLTGKASNANYPNYSNVGYSANFGYPSDVNAAVVHKPAMGIELGSALSYPVSRMFRFKAGLQLNYNQYLIQAYSYVPEIASYGANNAGFYSTPINQMSFYRNSNGYSRTWLKNEHFMISMPIGFEMNLAGRGDRVQVGIASTIQPTYILSDNAYLISTNLKNYAEASALYRNWNLNGSVEAFLSVNSGPVKWFVAPQFRYQLISSYTDNYPIREHLVEYGLKLGIKKTIR